MTEKQSYPQAQNPLILRASRLIEAFAKSDDERDFYLDRIEGFILYVDLDKTQESLDHLEKELLDNHERYCMIPKLSYYESKKIMESFVNEKVYDIDTKEKLLDIIQAKEARENFLEFIYDQHTELDKWQQYYQERSRIRIIEWLRKNHFQFVFEEDLDFTAKLIEKLKEHLFESKIGKDVANLRKTLFSKAKTYYSNEALNPRPKRGRPPKQQTKLEVEQQVSADIYTTVPVNIRLFLFTPDINSVSAATFSAKYENEEALLKSRGLMQRFDEDSDDELMDLNKKLASLRDLSNRWMQSEGNSRSGAVSAASNGDSSLKKDKKALKVKNTKPEKSAPPSADAASQKKPMRSIIKKSEETKPAKAKVKKTAAKSSTTKKRTAVKEVEKGSAKRSLRKIIPKK